MRAVYLSADERQALEQMAKRDAKPYRRERATALLKIAAGQPAAVVARSGLLRPRDPDTVYSWLDRYEQDGLAGLTIAPGRGRKPAFSPLRFGTRAAAQASLQELVERDPREFQQTGSRWTLDKIRQVCFFIRHYTRAGLWRVLQALRVHWKHARDHVHSPDPDYLAKQAYVARCGEQVRAAAETAVLLYQDEFTYYRQPSLAAGWAAAGSTHPLAERSQRSNTLTRLAGALNAATGQVTVVQGTRLGVGPLVRFYEQLGQAYPGRRLYLVQDNWPVHFHPDVLAALEPQEWPFAYVYPPSWPTAASPRARRLQLPLQLVPLPTYASNTNPIEKLWRWLKQEVLHLHRWADQLPELRRHVLDCFVPFATGSEALLRYVGLPRHPLPNDPAIPK